MYIYVHRQNAYSTYIRSGGRTDQVIWSEITNQRKLRNAMVGIIILRAKGPLQLSCRSVCPSVIFIILFFIRRFFFKLNDLNSRFVCIRRISRFNDLNSRFSLYSPSFTIESFKVQGLFRSFLTIS